MRKLATGNFRKFIGDWIQIDWPFARLLRISEDSQHILNMALFDVDCDDATQLVSSGKSRRIKVSPFKKIIPVVKDSTNIFFKAKYSKSAASVYYNLSCPRQGRIVAQSGWIEPFVNVEAKSPSFGDGSIICGEWRYADTGYSSIVIVVRNDALGQIKLSVLNSTDGSLVRVKNIKILKSEVSFCLSESGMLYRLLPIDNQKAICCCAKPKENWLRIHGRAETVPKKYTTFSIVGNSSLGGDDNVDFCSQIINDFTDPNHYELFLWSLDKINLECNVSVAITKMCRNGSMRNT